MLVDNLVVLVTGGSLYGSTHYRFAEVYNPVTNTSCSLPQLPEERYEHSQDGGLACGGNYSPTQSTCVKWSPASGNWTQSHIFIQRRWGHVSWATTSGVYLIGGAAGWKTSGKMKLDGSVEEGFNLKYSA